LKVLRLIRGILYLPERKGTVSGILGVHANTYRQEAAMEMKRISSGKLRAIGYDLRERILRVELDDGSAIDYAGVGDEIWRRLSSSGSAWSYYRDTIEEEFSGRKVTATSQKKLNPLDELFKK
jgi:hypothetical protein